MKPTITSQEKKKPYRVLNIKLCIKILIQQKIFDFPQIGTPQIKKTRQSKQRRHLYLPCSLQGGISPERPAHSMALGIPLGLFLWSLFLGACTKNISQNSMEELKLSPIYKKNSMSQLGSTGQSSQDQPLPTVSIHTQNLHSINSSNAAHLTLTGNCSENGQVVTIEVGQKVTPSAQPICSHQTWKISVDVTGLNKTLGFIPITVNHSRSNGQKSFQSLINVKNNFICPENFVGVPSLTGYTKKSFCVAKYEMKNDGSGGAISQADGLPYRMFNSDHSEQADDMTDAKRANKLSHSDLFLSRKEFIIKCQQMGDGYDLITNDEWQSLARHIESVSSNWSRGAVGLGNLNRGNSNIPTQGRTLPASSDDNPCFEMELPMGKKCNNHTWHDRKRTHILPNREIIWDVSGNIYDTVKDDHSGSYLEVDPFDSDLVSSSGIYISQITSKTASNMLKSLSGGTTTTPRSVKDQFGPSGNYTSFKQSPYGGLGYGWLTSTDNETMGYILRGGYYGTAISHDMGGKKIDPGGIFTFYLGSDGLDDQSSARVITGYNNGFRCAYHP